MNFENMNIWCWLIPALVGIICGILGYLLGSRGEKTIDNSAELKLLQDKNARLQADLDACLKKPTPVDHSADLNLLRNKNTQLQADLDACILKGETNSLSLKTAAASLAASAIATNIPFNADAAKAVFGKIIKVDDLKVVEGIGPKIESMFKEAGIKTWKALSEASVADCQKVLDDGGSRFQVHNPGSWPMQSKMAYEGKWEELSKWQDEHDYGIL